MKLFKKHLPDLLQEWASSSEVFPSFAQFGEDQAVLQYFGTLFFNPAHVKGYYVDLGAYDPIKSSNTYLLHLLGWRGMNIDANFENIKRFNTERPDDINIASGVSDRNEALVFHALSLNGASSFDPHQIEHMKSMDIDIVRSEEVQCRDVNELLDENLPTNIKINYMNIDLEGFDERVLLHLDIEKFRPQVLTIEILHADLVETINHPVTRKMVKAGYRYIARYGLTSFFVDDKNEVQM